MKKFKKQFTAWLLMFSLVFCMMPVNVWAAVAENIAAQGYVHEHNFACYSEYWLSCGQEEGEGHLHTSACYSHTDELVCGMEDGQTYYEGEYTRSENYVARFLVCGQQEHEHSDECIAAEKPVVQPIEELKPQPEGTIKPDTAVLPEVINPEEEVKPEEDLTIAQPATPVEGEDPEEQSQGPQPAADETPAEGEEPGADENLDENDQPAADETPAEGDEPGVDETPNLGDEPGAGEGPDEDQEPDADETPAEGDEPGAGEDSDEDQPAADETPTEGDEQNQETGAEESDGQENGAEDQGSADENNEENDNSGDDQAEDQSDSDNESGDQSAGDNQDSSDDSNADDQSGDNSGDDDDTDEVGSEVEIDGGEFDPVSSLGGDLTYYARALTFLSNVKLPEVLVPKADSPYTCGLEEHSHDDSCYEYVYEYRIVENDMAAELAAAVEAFMQAVNELPDLEAISLEDEAALQEISDQVMAIGELFMLIGEAYDADLLNMADFPGLDVALEKYSVLLSVVYGINLLETDIQATAVAFVNEMASLFPENIENTDPEAFVNNYYRVTQSNSEVKKNFDAIQKAITDNSLNEDSVENLSTAIARYNELGTKFNKLVNDFDNAVTNVSIPDDDDDGELSKLFVSVNSGIIYKQHEALYWANKYGLLNDDQLEKLTVANENYLQLKNGLSSKDRQLQAYLKALGIEEGIVVKFFEKDKDGNDILLETKRGEDNVIEVQANKSYRMDLTVVAGGGIDTGKYYFDLPKGVQVKDASDETAGSSHVLRIDENTIVGSWNIQQNSDGSSRLMLDYNPQNNKFTNVEITANIYVEFSADQDKLDFKTNIIVSVVPPGASSPYLLKNGWRNIENGTIGWEIAFSGGSGSMQQQVVGVPLKDVINLEQPYWTHCFSGELYFKVKTTEGKQYGWIVYSPDRDKEPDYTASVTVPLTKWVKVEDLTKDELVQLGKHFNLTANFTEDEQKLLITQEELSGENKTAQDKAITKLRNLLEEQNCCVGWTYTMPESIWCAVLDDDGNPIKIGENQWQGEQVVLSNEYDYIITYVTQPVNEPIGAVKSTTKDYKNTFGIYNIWDDKENEYQPYKTVNAVVTKYYGNGSRVPDIKKTNSRNMDGQSIDWKIEAAIPGGVRDKNGKYVAYLLGDSIGIYEANNKILDILQYPDYLNLDEISVTVEVDGEEKQAVNILSIDPDVPDEDAPDYAYFINNWGNNKSDDSQNGREEDYEICAIYLAMKYNADDDLHACTSSNRINNYCYCWQLEEDATVTIQYTTPAKKVVELEVENGGIGRELANKVSISRSPLIPPEEPSDIGKNWDYMRDSLSKRELNKVFGKKPDQSLDDAYKGMSADYSIVVNEDAEYNLDQDDLVVKDTMNGLTYTEETLKVLQDGEPFENYELSFDKEKPNEIKVTIHQPGKHEYKIQYNTTIVEPVNFSNSAEVTLWGQTFVQNVDSKGKSTVITKGETFNVKLIKEDTQNSAIKLDGALFELYDSQGRLMATAETGDKGNATGEYLFESKTNQLVFQEHELYYLQELMPPDGYKINADKHFFYFCKSGENGGCNTCQNDPNLTNATCLQPTGGTIAIGNEPIPPGKGSLVIEKKIDGNGANKVDSNKEFKFTITGPYDSTNQDSRVETKTVLIKVGKRAELELEPGTYTITEDDATISGSNLEWTFSFSVNGVIVNTDNGSANVNVEEGKAYNVVVTNTYTEIDTEPETIKLEVEKQWKDAKGDVLAANDPTLPSVTVQLLRNGKEHLGPVTLNSGNNWSHKWENLPKSDSNGDDYSYTVQEVNVAGYTPSYNTDGNKVTITNTKESTSFTVEKQWVDGNSVERPESIQVQLLQDGAVLEVVTLTGANWQHTWTDLPKYKNDGKTLYQYTVRETSVPNGYKAEVKYDNNKAVITNTLTTEISVNKEWVDNGNADEKRPEYIQVQLLQGETAYGELVELNAKNNWQHTWTDLPKYNENDSENVYTVNEITVPNYISSQTKEGNSITITNTLTTEMSVDKVWQDDNNADGNRPDSIEVQLLQDNNVYDTVALNAGNGWHYKWTNLPKYEADGNEHEYTVAEINVPEGYESKETSQGNVVTIVNTKVKPTPENVSLTVTKSWDDNNNAVGDRPEAISVQLLQNGEAYGDPETLNADNAWQHTWGELPKLDDNNDEYSYTVAEVDVPEGYISSITTPADGVITITNTHKPTVDWSVHKVWQDNENAENERPDSIEVQLQQNGEAYGEPVTLNADNNWQYTWSNLPKLDENEEAYTYDVTEITELENYTSTSSTTGTTVTITNTYTEETQEIGSLIINKEVVGGGEAAENKVFSFTVTGPNYNETVTITGAGSVTLTDLTLGTYTVTENSATAGINGYTLTVSPDVTVTVNANQTAEATITNTYTQDTTTFSVNKSWDDNDDATGVRPDSVTVQLLQNGTAYATIVLNADNNWRYTWNDLPKNDANDETYIYTVEEVDVPEGYQSDLSQNATSATIINSLIPETPVGRLAVTKQVSGSAVPQADTVYTINVTLTYPGGGRTETLELRAGETRVIPDLPVGTTYTVTEDNFGQSQINWNYSDSNKQIDGSETDTVIVTNVYEPQNPPTPTTPTTPETPGTPETPSGGESDNPETPIGNPETPTSSFELPDPNEPFAPDEVTIFEDDVPLTYVKTYDPDTEEYVYIEDDDVPLAYFEDDIPKTGDAGYVTLLAAVWLVSLSGMGALVYDGRRRKNN